MRLGGSPHCQGQGGGAWIDEAWGAYSTVKGNVMEYGSVKPWAARPTVKTQGLAIRLDLILKSYDFGIWDQKFMKPCGDQLIL